VRRGVGLLDRSLSFRQRLRRAARVLRTAARLGPADGAIVTLAAGLLAWYRLRIGLAGGGHRLLARGRIGGLDVARVATAADRDAADRLARLFHHAAARPALGGSCIPRSLALARLLRLHGLPAGVQIGLRRAAGALAGHAWVEHDGRVIGEQEGARLPVPLQVRGLARLRRTE
jgi:hypothetical protein